MSVNPYLSGAGHLDEKGEVVASYAIRSSTMAGLCISTGNRPVIAPDRMLPVTPHSTGKDNHSVATSERGHIVYIAKGRDRLSTRNSGRPKERNLYGCGYVIVGHSIRMLHTKARKSNNCSKLRAQDGPKSLGQILTYDKEGRCNNAYKTLTNINVLHTAYMKIKSEPGNMTPGPDKETLDGISEEWFENTSQLLTNQSFRFKPTRRVYIPKANGKMRPLGIASPRDKIIQEAYRAILEQVLEDKFSDKSHGFRPSRGCHSALAEIRYWNGIKWFVEGDIKSFFDSINHHLLEKLLKRHFNDQ